MNYVFNNILQFFEPLEAFKIANQIFKDTIFKDTMDAISVIPGEHLEAIFVKLCENNEVDKCQLFLQDKRMDISSSANRLLSMACNKNYGKLCYLLLSDGRADPTSVKLDTDFSKEIIRLFWKDKRMQPEDPAINDLWHDFLVNSAYENKIANVQLIITNRNISRWTGNATYDTILQVSIAKGYVELVELLLKDDKIEVDDYDLIETLRCSTRNSRNYKKIFRLLLEDGRADPRYRNYDCLGYACRDGNYNAVKLLLKDKRVDPTVTLDGWGARTFIELAQKHHHYDIVNLLLGDRRIL